jgi:hypothetical protein
LAKLNFSESSADIQGIPNANDIEFIPIDFNHNSLSNIASHAGFQNMDTTLLVLARAFYYHQFINRRKVS